MVFRRLVAGILLVLALSGCRTPPDTPSQFYLDVLTTEVWFVLQEHPEARAAAERRDFSSWQWQRFRELLTKIPAGQELKEPAVVAALTRE